ncbi:hypothetical protein E4T56_gene7979 [Termitomyces sp. T112]|nr:hypothetical protein E4T56_gene7979 [Termitomyces sp. T112]
MIRLSYILALLVMVYYVNSAAINDSSRLGTNLHANSDPQREQPDQVIQRQSENRFWTNRPFLHREPSPVTQRALSASSNGPVDARPTPDPTGDPSSLTTVHINSATDFSLILPKIPGELIGAAEKDDGLAYSSPNSDPSSCDGRHFMDGFITAAAYSRSDDGAYVQVTGCLNPTKFHLDPSDEGGQFDVRYPNGAQCTFGGYGASFIELVEPRLNRFCIRCCASPNDQTNCNSHQDRMGCMTAIPGIYEFPELGVSCTQ